MHYNRYLEDAFHGRHVAAKFLADYFYRMATDRVVNRDQFPIVDIIVSANTLANNVCIDFAHEVSQKRSAGVIEQVATVLGSIGNHHVHLV